MVGGTGNALANRLVGLGGNDTLNGGAGAELMTGGAGNDRDYVDAVGDAVVGLSRSSSPDIGDELVGCSLRKRISQMVEEGRYTSA